jgi:hypothetical protein
MSRNDEELIEEEKPGNEVVDIDLDDALYKEALKDVLAVNEELPSEPDVKSPELREFIAFKQECDALMSLLKPYIKDSKFDILSEDFDLKKAIEVAKTLIGVPSDEEVIEGEPSPYVQELFKRLWQKYIDCKWFEAMMRGKRPVTLKDLKFQKAPEELIRTEGEKI